MTAGERWRAHVTGAVVLAALGAAVYANSLGLPFVFDDRAAILDNPHVRSLWPLSQALSAPPRSILTGRPVVSLSLAMNHAVGSLDPRGYHAVNLALHVLAALVLLGIVGRTLEGPRLAREFRGSGHGLALAVAAIWLVHPLETEAVTYVTQRTELLMGLFVLLTLFSAVRGWPAASVLCCALAVGCKETAAAAPLLVVLYDRVFLFPSLAAAVRARWRLYAGLGATWGLLAASLLLLPRHESVGFGHGITAWEYARTQLAVLARYLRLAFWPDALCVDHGVWVASTAREIVPGALLAGMLVAGTVVALRRARPVGFLGAWFLVLLAPTSSVVPIVTEVMAERRMYLPLAAVVTLVVVGGRRLLGRAVASERGRRIAGTALVATTVVVLGLLTVRRNRDYTTEVGLWRDVVRKRPENARAHNNLASLLLHQGDLDGAAAAVAAALELRPDYAEAHYNLGTVLLARGRMDEAAARFAEALRLDPRLVEAHYNLGTLLLHQGRYAEAITHYEEALRLRPDHANARTNLATARAALAGQPSR